MTSFAPRSGNGSIAPGPHTKLALVATSRRGPTPKPSLASARSYAGRARCAQRTSAAPPDSHGRLLRVIKRRRVRQAAVEEEILPRHAVADRDAEELESERVGGRAVREVLADLDRERRRRPERPSGDEHRAVDDDEREEREQER